jgi:hypothetical protein
MSASWVLRSRLPFCQKWNTGENTIYSHIDAGGLRRVQSLGATVAFVGGYSPEGNALYTAVMGKEYDLSERWVKVF